MPRCEVCNRMQPSVDVRKMPSRDAHRCKERFDCELAATNRHPYTATLTITFPAKHMGEAWDICEPLVKQMRPYPTTIEQIEGGGKIARTKKEAVASYDDGPEALKELLSF